MKLLVCRTRTEAEHMKEVFGLNGEWEARGIADSLVGSRFDEIVVIKPQRSTSRMENVATNEAVKDLSLKLLPTGKLVIFNGR